MGFVPSQFDNSFYVLRKGADVCMVWIHVDDGAVTGSNPTLLAEVEKELAMHIKIKWKQSSLASSVSTFDVYRLTTTSCLNLSWLKRYLGTTPISCLH